MVNDTDTVSIAHLWYLYKLVFIYVVTAEVVLRRSNSAVVNIFEWFDMLVMTTDQWDKRAECVGSQGKMEGDNWPLEED